MQITIPERPIVTPMPLDECLEVRKTFIWPETDTVGMWDDNPSWPELNARVPLDVAQQLGETIADGPTYGVFIEGCPLAWWSLAGGLIKPTYSWRAARVAA